ncbi:MAG: MerR family transcriptional regulator [Burkholderiales bacterium]|nr:MerR family transcriptional regulator [Betaproteobacteria bacterium]MDX2218277.1 MerR family transcriptional regulator [Burkholderiales bacterium]
MHMLTIGQVSKKSGVHVETIRYYQRLGLVVEPPRAPGSFRYYGDDSVARLRFIKRAQQLGFTLDEVRNLLMLEDGQSCSATRTLAEMKLAAIETRLADLGRMRKLLRGLIHECDSGKQPRRCPIIETLSRSTHEAA